MSNYSANNELINFFKKMDFDVYIFDNPEKYSNKIKLRDKTTDCEIDAIAIYNNILILIEIKDGVNEKIKKQIENYFKDLRDFDTNRIYDLEIVISKKDKENDNKIKAAEKDLNDLKNRMSNISNDYDIHIRKLAFMPNYDKLDYKKIQNYHINEKYTIDKRLYQYFISISDTINKKYMKHDFFNFIRIRKRDLKERSYTIDEDLATTDSYQAIKMELIKNKMYMFTTSIRPNKIIDFITVWSMAKKYSKLSFQRMISRKRLKNINKNYLKDNETFPNNIIIFLNPDYYNDMSKFYKKSKKTIHFLDEFNSLIIIDGQHRFFSFISGDKNNEILLSFIYIKNADGFFNIVADTFFQINDNQKGIDPNLSFSLKAKIRPTSDESFWFNVFEKLDKSGFFKEKYSFDESIYRSSKKLSAYSLIKYGGILKLNYPVNKRGQSFKGLNVFFKKTNSFNSKVIIAKNIIWNFFEIIERVVYNKKGVNKKDLRTRDIGALFRLIRHFIFENQKLLGKLNSENNISKSIDMEDKKAVSYLEKILNCIQFKQLQNKSYSTSNWGAIEGFFLKNINKKYKNFVNNFVLPKFLYFLFIFFRKNPSIAPQLLVE
jgi:DGQHR domain-containing protein